ncbi:ASCH domain-containing protein [Porphyromonas catoniae]|uniref:ASCH domain-containing protein n=1 Tax=Porphyromonas catoniae TaxID=41976 RepID=UPI0023F23FDD|nr:ASCH domain-containing protein [Porphyromonas catoniae]
MSAKVLLSIKPEFVEKIASGHKCFEYRRVLYKRTDIKRIVVYASSPVCRIVGEIEVGNLLTDTPEVLWERTKDKAGISEDFFLKYFAERPHAHAIEIKAFHPYRKPKRLADKYPNTTPPQSFCYL